MSVISTNLPKTLVKIRLGLVTSTFRRILTLPLIIVATKVPFNLGLMIITIYVSYIFGTRDVQLPVITTS